ncbi:hypothetical protein ACVW16_005427 [Bradyrhizobium sp. USDA 4474]
MTGSNAFTEKAGDERDRRRVAHVVRLESEAEHRNGLAAQHLCSGVIVFS